MHIGKCHRVYQSYLLLVGESSFPITPLEVAAYFNVLRRAKCPIEPEKKREAERQAALKQIIKIKK